MKKKLSQFTDPAIMYAAGREVCVNSSVVKMFVTPPSQKKNQQKKSLLAVTIVQQQLLRKDFNGGKSYWFSWLPGPKPKLRIKANTHAMLKYGNTGLASWEKDYHTKEMLARSATCYLWSYVWKLHETMV